MKKKIVLLTIALVALMVVNSCSKETIEKEEQTKIVMSAGQDNFWCDDEFCYWIDPELLDPPILVDPSYGPQNLKKEYLEGTLPNGTKIRQLKCPDRGIDCGKIFEPDGNGVIQHVGYYATN